MSGFYGTNKQSLGQIIEPCSCCDPVFNVFGFTGEKRWVITAQCCQCGIVCRNGCGKCSDVLFTIHKPGKTEMNPQNAEGSIKKKFSGFQELISDADNFELTFPEQASPEDKFLLIGAVIMIDFRFYEDGGAQNNRRGGVYI
jgi:hypothetical protein